MSGKAWYVDHEVGMARKHYNDALTVGELMEELARLDPATRVYRDDCEYPRTPVSHTAAYMQSVHGVEIGPVVEIV